MALIPPWFLDCAVAIGTGPEADKRWIASGFLYGRYVLDVGGEKKYRTYLVTNVHVLKDLTTIWLRFNPEGDEPPNDVSVGLLDADGQRRWIAHPDDTIDVAVFGIDFGGLKKLAMQVAFFQDDDHALNRAKMADDGVSEGDHAYVLGFPLGLVGEKRMAVIVRSASIARIRDVLREGMPTYLLDASVFPGNSGGPVVLMPEVTSITGTKAHAKAMLIGIVRWYVPYQDEAISRQTGRTRVIFEENSGLAGVHPVDYIDETIDEHNKRFPILDTAMSGDRTGGAEPESFDGAPTS